MTRLTVFATGVLVLGTLAWPTMTRAHCLATSPWIDQSTGELAHHEIPVWIVKGNPDQGIEHVMGGADLVTRYILAAMQRWNDVPAGQPRFVFAGYVASEEAIAEETVGLLVRSLPNHMMQNVSGSASPATGDANDTDVPRWVVNLNADWHYFGPASEGEDLLATILHELGHVLGLGHPDNAARGAARMTPDGVPAVGKCIYGLGPDPAQVDPAAILSVMTPGPSLVKAGLFDLASLRRWPRQDDVSGLTLLYGSETLRDLADPAEALASPANPNALCDDLAGLDVGWVARNCAPVFAEDPPAPPGDLFPPCDPLVDPNGCVPPPPPNPGEPGPQPPDDKPSGQHCSATCRGTDLPTWPLFYHEDSSPTGPFSDQALVPADGGGTLETTSTIPAASISDRPARTMTLATTSATRRVRWAESVDGEWCESLENQNVGGGSLDELTYAGPAVAHGIGATMVAWIADQDLTSFRHVIKWAIRVTTGLGFDVRDEVSVESATRIAAGYSSAIDRFLVTTMDGDGQVQLLQIDRDGVAGPMLSMSVDALDVGAPACDANRCYVPYVGLDVTLRVRTILDVSDPGDILLGPDDAILAPGGTVPLVGWGQVQAAMDYGDDPGGAFPWFLALGPTNLTDLTGPSRPYRASGRPDEVAVIATEFPAFATFPPAIEGPAWSPVIGTSRTASPGETIHRVLRADAQAIGPTGPTRCCAASACQPPPPEDVYTGCLTPDEPSGEPGCPCAEVMEPFSAADLLLPGFAADGQGSFLETTSGRGQYCKDEELGTTHPFVCGVKTVKTAFDFPICKECGVETAFGCPCDATTECQGFPDGLPLVCWGSTATQADPDEPYGGWGPTTTEKSGTCLPDPALEPEAFEDLEWFCKDNCASLGNALGIEEQFKCVFNQLAVDFEISGGNAHCVDVSGCNAPAGACEEQGGLCDSTGTESECVAECDPLTNTAQGNPDCIAHGFPAWYLCDVFGSQGYCVPGECVPPKPPEPDLSECLQFF